MSLDFILSFMFEGFEEKIQVCA